MVLSFKVNATQKRYVGSWIVTVEVGIIWSNHVKLDTTLNNAETNVLLSISHLWLLIRFLDRCVSCCFFFSHKSHRNGLLQELHVHATKSHPSLLSFTLKTKSLLQLHKMKSLISPSSLGLNLVLYALSRLSKATWAREKTKNYFCRCRTAPERANEGAAKSWGDWSPNPLSASPLLGQTVGSLSSHDGRYNVA